MPPILFLKLYLIDMSENFDIIKAFPTPIYRTMLPENLGNVVNWLHNQPIKITSTPHFGRHSENTYILNEPECKNLSEFILDKVTYFAQNILCIDYPEFKFTQSWISQKYPGESHAYHQHSNSIISGVFFYGTPTEETPALTFRKNTSNGNNYNIYINHSPYRNESEYGHEEIFIKFTPGLLLLFPSYVFHSVPLNSTDTVRNSLAFNVVPKYGLGDINALSELKF